MTILHRLLGCWPFRREIERTPDYSFVVDGACSWRVTRQCSVCGTRDSYLLNANWGPLA